MTHRVNGNVHAKFKNNIKIQNPSVITVFLVPPTDNIWALLITRRIRQRPCPLLYCISHSCPVVIKILTCAVLTC